MKLVLFPIFYPRAAVVLAALVFYLFFMSSAKAIELKHNSIIESSVITLGDVFYDLPHSADKVLGPAPRPGSDMTLNARTLLRIAMAMKLDWRPSSGADYITLQRAATLISKDDIRKELSAAIKDSGYTGDFELDIPAQAAEIILPVDQAATFEMDTVTIDPKTDRFHTTLYAPSKANPLQTMRVAGAIHQVAKVPVLTSTMRNGTIIKASDIEMLTLRSRDLSADMILDADALVGTTPRRMILNGKPVTDNDIQAPQIVTRGQTVTMIFSNGTLQLTAQGKAMESGAKGDAIRVVNANSSRSVQAIVSGEKEVTIQSF